MMIDSANRDTFFMWLNLCKLYAERDNSPREKLMFGWHDDGHCYVCIPYHQAKTWVENFFKDHPNNALIVAEIVGVWGKV